MYYRNWNNIVINNNIMIICIFIFQTMNLYKLVTQVQIIFYNQNNVKIIVAIYVLC